MATTEKAPSANEGNEGKPFWCDQCGDGYPTVIDGRCTRCKRVILIDAPGVYDATSPGPAPGYASPEDGEEPPLPLEGCSFEGCVLAAGHDSDCENADGEEPPLPLGDNPPVEEPVDVEPGAPISDAEAFDQELEERGVISPGPVMAPSLEAILATIAQIDRSHNYRKTYPAADMEELTASVAAKGVIQPIVLRPNTSSIIGAPAWLLVAGERRVRASIAAGLTMIPATVRRDLDDASARELSIIENLQRKNVDPLEEADGFRELHEELGRSVDQIAASIGQKKGYVYGRLKLCALGAEGRKAFRDGELDVSAAILVARIPDKKMQAQAVELVAGGRFTYEQAARAIHDRFMLRLAGAPFDTTDDALVAAAGSCAKCPKRTGNQRELFADVKSADVCTDPSCFKKKADAAWIKTAAAAEEKGQKVLEGKAAEVLFPQYTGGRLAHNAPYVDLEDQCFEDKKHRQYKKLIGKDAPLVLARDPQGRVHHLVARAELPAVIKGDAGKELAKLERSAAAADGAEKARRRKLERRRLVVGAVIAELVAKAKPDAPVLSALLDAMSRGGYSNAIADVVKRRGWAVKGKRPGVIFDEQVELLGKNAGALFGLLVELTVSRDAYFAYSTNMPESVSTTAEAAGVNVKAIEKRVGAEAADKAANKAKPKAKKKGGKK